MASSDDVGVGSRYPSPIFPESVSSLFVASSSFCTRFNIYTCESTPIEFFGDIISYVITLGEFF